MRLKPERSQPMLAELWTDFGWAVVLAVILIAGGGVTFSRRR